MTLSSAIQLFENLKSETSKKAEIKVYEKFIHILTQLQSRSFSESDLRAIETKLGALQLSSNVKNPKKHYSKALSEFESYLKSTFQLTPKGHYTRLGIALGVSFGMLFGVVFLSRFERSLGISYGSSFGLLLGLLIGRSMDAKAVLEGRAF